jgi:hypothetical protein
MAKGQSRRQFLKNLGIGTGGLLLANAGISAGFLGDAQRVMAQNSLLASTGRQIAPNVELLCSDVIAFALNETSWEGAFGSVTFQMHRAWFNGEDVYYVRTDASNQEFATENGLVFVPLLNAALSADGATSQMYTFTNGAADQYPVVSSAPSEENYSSAWQIVNVTFNGDPSVLTSVEEITAAEEAGDVTLEPQQLVVNFPIVKWPGGELQEDTEKVGYLGTGPLVSPVNTDNMTVNFKLHECYPGSRYIITDTSAAPMAPMMAIAASVPTQALVEVGATDEIWVFGNGIPGSGVMGFQAAIFDNAAGDPVWSPFWNHFTAVWTNEDEATIVTSSDELRSLVEAGALEIFNGTPNTDPNGFVVNCPVPIKARNTLDA